MHRIAIRGIGVALLSVGVSAVAAAATIAAPGAQEPTTPPTVVVTGVPTPAPAPGADTGDESREEVFVSPTLPTPASPDPGPLEPPTSTTSLRPPSAGGLDATASSTTAPAPLPRLLGDGTPTGRVGLVTAVEANAAAPAPAALPTTGPGLAATAGFALVAAGVAIVAAAGRRDLRRPAGEDQTAAT